MITRLKGDLENVIEKWINDHCDDDDWIDHYVYNDLSKDMASVAELVFDASCKGQKFLREAT